MRERNCKFLKSEKVVVYFTASYRFSKNNYLPSLFSEALGAVCIVEMDLREDILLLETGEVIFILQETLYYTTKAATKEP